jgi:Domain of unknown function (DUF4913)
VTQLEEAPVRVPGDARLLELEARVARMAADLADLTAAVTVPGKDSAGTDEDPDPVYATLTDWVEQYFCVTFSRSIGGETRWCPRWHEHTEAVIRLEALWRSWETLRLDANLGIANWLTSFLDPQLLVVLGQRGPFAQCGGGRHQASAPLVTVQQPAAPLGAPGPARRGN